MADRRRLSTSVDSRVLRKPLLAQGHVRAVSAQHPNQQRSISAAPSRPSLQELRLSELEAGLPAPLPPPPVLGNNALHSRSSSVDWSSRPSSVDSARNIQLAGQNEPALPSVPTLGLPATANKKETRKSWLGVGNGKLMKKDKHEEHRAFAWIAGHPDRPVYEADALVDGLPVKDIWDDRTGDCLVYLFPQESGRGPSFKINSAVLDASPVLTRMMQVGVSTSGLTNANSPPRLAAHAQKFGLDYLSTPPMTPDRSLDFSGVPSLSFSLDPPPRHHPMEATMLHLFLPVKLHPDSLTGNSHTVTPPRGRYNIKDPNMENLQVLIDIRNFFAFLCGQSLVATERRNSFCQIFMHVASILETYGFTDDDGNTYGPVASTSFDTYVDELRLGDVRGSREKTLEALVLGERMKSVLLYNEAFTHAVGKHDDIIAMKSPTFAAISSVTQQRIERAALDLEKRTASIRLILESFEFPALFTGIMASKTSAERKEGVRFEAWKESFLALRRNTLSMLKDRYGAWPPKAKSKKNNLETSGLNRLVLKDLYGGMCSLYDLLVDRTNLTTRTVDGADVASDQEEAIVRALRIVLSEYDRSSPPVKPPVPFDLPLVPAPQVMYSVFKSNDKRADNPLAQKKFKGDDAVKILARSYNDDVPSNPFVEVFRDTERRAAHGSTLNEITDQRIGHWIFIYVVLQALPMLACDAPEIKWSRGCEYFLCEAPRIGVPWAKSHDIGRNTWYTIENGGGVVNLPSDVLLHSVEGIYRRSHCWTMAERWTAANPRLNTALHEHEAIETQALNRQYSEELTPPPPMSSMHSLAPSSRSSSPMSRNKRISSLGMGLEALHLPAGADPEMVHSRSSSREPEARRRSVQHQVDKDKTFDSILAAVEGGNSSKSGKKGKKR